MARVVFLADDPDWLGPALREAAAGRSYEFLSKDAPADALASALSEAEALIAGPGDALAVQPACPGLRFVQFTSCDYDQAALAELQSRGLPVASLGAVLAADVAAIAVGLILAIQSGSRRTIKPGDEAWDRLLHGLSGKTVGIIGVGRVGTSVARLLRQHGAVLTFSDVRTPPRALSQELGIRRSTQDRLLVDSDFVTVHVPVTSQSKNLLGRREFGLLRADSVLINTSSPELIDRSTLLSALKDRRIRGFGTTDLDPALASFSNVVMADPKALRTPDVAAKVAARIVGNVNDALEGGKPHGLVETIGFPRAGDPAFWSSRMAPRVENDPEGDR